MLASPWRRDYGGLYMIPPRCTVRIDQLPRRTAAQRDKTLAPSQRVNYQTLSGVPIGGRPLFGSARSPAFAE
jgi:hypothetical protein